MNAVADPLADPLLRSRAAYQHWVQEHVRWSDTDMAGHANNLAFAAFAESGRALILRRFLEKGTERYALLVLAEMRLKYLGEMHWPAVIDVGSAVCEISTRSCRMVQALFDGERCVAVIESVLVSVDDGTRRARAIPDAVRAELQEWALVRSA